MDKKTYAEKLKDPRWQKKRLEILERDNWTCRHCFATDKTLHVHHLIYTTDNPWDCDPDILITLCEECHNYESEVRNEWDMLLTTQFRCLGLSADDIFFFYFHILNTKNKKDLLTKIRAFIDEVGKENK